MKTPEKQGSRPMVVIGMLAVPLLLAIGLYVFRSGQKPSVSETVVATPAVHSVSIMAPVSAPVVIAVPNQDGGDGIPAETRKALEAAGLLGVKLTSLALSTGTRPPVIIGSAVGK